MIDNIELAQLDGNRLEIHYWLIDGSHLMDANVENKCNYEILGIIKEVAKSFSVDITIETEPLGEGGLRKWLRISRKEEDKKGTITTTIIVAIITALLVSPISFAPESHSVAFVQSGLGKIKKCAIPYSNYV